MNNRRGKSTVDVGCGASVLDRNPGSTPGFSIRVGSSAVSAGEMATPSQVRVLPGAFCLTFRAHQRMLQTINNSNRTTKENCCA